MRCLIFFFTLILTTSMLGQDFIKQYEKNYNLSKFEELYIIQNKNSYRDIKVLDKKGKMIYETEGWGYSAYFYEGVPYIYVVTLTDVPFKNRKKIKEAYKLVYYDLKKKKTGEFNHIFTGFFSFRDKEKMYAKYEDKNNGKLGIIDGSMNVVIPAVYDDIDIFTSSPNLFAVRKGDKYTLLDTTGKNVIGTEYTNPNKDGTYPDTRFKGPSDEVFIVGSMDGQKVGVYNVSQKKVFIPFEYESIGDYYPSVNAVEVKQQGYSALLDLSNNSKPIYDQSFKITRLMNTFRYGQEYVFSVNIEKDKTNRFELNKNLIYQGKLVFDSKYSIDMISDKSLNDDHFVFGELASSKPFLYDFKEKREVISPSAEIKDNFRIHRVENFKGDKDLYLLNVLPSGQRNNWYLLYDASGECLVSFYPTKDIEIITVDEANKKYFYKAKYSLRDKEMFSVYKDAHNIIIDNANAREVTYEVKDNIFTKEYIEDRIIKNQEGAKSLQKIQIKESYTADGEYIKKEEQVL
ncbi:WG repeat-containing protein [Myroides odoratimimus]|uniref:WG repeat-containing protein n=1 Tax=Myroides odoratimimus TaxID=76832 RepID=UPI0038D51494